ncbi:regulator of G-protein signaling 12 isoform X2 [Esox lucius]|uniref:regulator of G-protein signaling 12 isoform X2 n=1 Tax=Esox lucius TaxID=8010 RepID=UPI0010BE1B2A|nr:regulator of G-protein signaling 12 isoform X2 [Esox lucius]
MRRFSSEGSLLGMDFLPRQKVALKDHHRDEESGTYTPYREGGKPDGRPDNLPPIILEPGDAAGNVPERAELNKEHSVSVENLTGLAHLGVGNLSEGCRAYSDGQLAPALTGGSMESVGQGGQPPPSPSYSADSPNHFSFKSQQRHHARAKLSAAKLHLKSLFGQSPHSSHSNLFNPEQKEQKDRAKERRSRLPFLRQWSEVGHSKARFNREELDKWAESLNALLASRIELAGTHTNTRSRYGATRQCNLDQHPFHLMEASAGPSAASRCSLAGSSCYWLVRQPDVWRSQQAPPSAGVSVFGAFLRSEFSEENLQFYLACEQYRNSSNNFSLHRRAKEITATYIETGAPREVNLDSKTRELTRQLLQAPSHTSLSHAQKRIYSLLDTDCYPRFLQSPIYLTLLHEAD